MDVSRSGDSSEPARGTSELPNDTSRLAAARQIQAEQPVLVWSVVERFLGQR